MEQELFSGNEGAALGLFVISIYGMSCLALLVFLVAQWKIYAKTGNNGALSLLILVPILGIGVILWLAFSEWPIERQVAKLKAKLKQAGGAQDDWD